MQFTSEIHNFIKLAPEARVLKVQDESCSFIHFNFIDVEHFLDKFNRYSTIEANHMAAVVQSSSILHMFYGMFKEFVMRFVKQKGYKDGFQGLALSLLLVTYRVSINLKLYLILRYSAEPGTNIREFYSQVATKTLEGHKCLQK